MTRLVYSRSSRPGERFMDQPYWWHHYLVIEDQRVTIIDMKRAGTITFDPSTSESKWNWDFYELTVQDNYDWPNMSAEEIVTWKSHNGDDRLREVPRDEAARVLAWLDSRP